MAEHKKNTCSSAPVPSSVTCLHEVVDLCGKHFYPNDWIVGDWKVGLTPLIAQINYDLGIIPQPDMRERQHHEMCRVIIQNINKWVKVGLLNLFHYNDGSPDYLPAYKSSDDDTNHFWHENIKELYVAKDELNKCLGSDLIDVKGRSNAGAKPKYDWESFYLEVIRIANTPDGLPETKADMISIMAQWCQNTWNEEPSDTSLKDKIYPIHDYVFKGQ
jgi:hypothetical protein